MQNCQYLNSGAVQFYKHNVWKVFFEAVNNEQSETNLGCGIQLQCESDEMEQDQWEVSYTEG